MQRPLESRPLRPLLGIALGLLAWLGSAQTLHASGFTPGNLVVVRVGDGTATLTNASTAVFLDEYTSAGAFVQSVALPTSVAGNQYPLTNSGVATSEGYLNLSDDGRYLVQAGYSAAPGMTGIASTTSAVAPRLVGRTELSTATTDTSTIFSGDTSYSANNIRSATSLDGAEFWTAGTAGAGTDGGVRYVASLGANTSTQLSANVTNTRVIGIYAGQVYVSSASGSFKGVSMVGTGLPTTSGQTITLLPGFPSASPSQYDFFFADPSTLYVAEDGSSGATGGIQKWTETGGLWTLQYTLQPLPSQGCRGLTGIVVGGVATLYASTTESSLNNIVSVTDTGATSTFATVASASTNEVFRGMRLLPNATGSAGVPFCDPGQGGVLACPCANPPSGSGRGCDNSAATGGASISATGTASLANDTLVFATADEKPTATTVLLQGQSSTNGVAFGQGVRCVGGVLKRLYVKSASGGSITAPLAGDPSVSTQSSNLGDLIAAGQHRYYMVYYRDPVVLGGCSALDTFNASSAFDVTWNP